MDNKDKYIIILFNGFNSSKIFWNYVFEDKPELRKIDFLDKIKKIGKTYTFNQSFFNINYYSTPDNKKDKILWEKIYEKYKPHSSNINFQLEDLDYKNICKKIYDSVRQKYGNNKKYIIIGHSYGGCIALLFSKLYKNECILCCCIDNQPYILSFFNKYNDKNNKNILEKYPSNNELKKSLKIIKNSEDIKEKNKEIDDIYKLISYKSCQDRIKYYDNKLYIPTIIFRAYYSKPKDYQIDWNKYSMKEKKIFEKDKNMKKYIIMNDAEHFIWKNQEFSDIIIDTIKELLQ
jgi:alpha/beta superfamily hydrolase